MGKIILCKTACLWQTKQIDLSPASERQYPFPKIITVPAAVPVVAAMADVPRHSAAAVAAMAEAAGDSNSHPQWKKCGKVDKLWIKVLL